MAQIKKEQLIKIINKEYTDILKEVKINEAYFNQIAYEHVIHNLIKEGVLEEAWYDWVPGGQTAKMRRSLKDAGALGDPRALTDDPAAYAQMYGELTPQGGREYEEQERAELYGDQAGYGTMGQLPVEGGEEFAPTGEEATDEEVAVQAPFDMYRGARGQHGGTPLDVDYGSGFPQHLVHTLVDVAQSAPSQFRKNIPKIGDAVFNQLEGEIGNVLTQDQTARLVIDIINTVVKALGTSRSWESGVVPV